MDETLFYVFGIGLVVSAIGLTAIGLRIESFPPTRAVLALVVAYFVGMVAATTTFAVLNARDEAHKREAKQAEEAAANGEQGSGTATTTTTPSGGGGSSTRQTAVKLSAAPDAIAYDTKTLAAHAGQVEVAFTNPAPIAHDVCLSGPGGEQVGCSETVTDSNTTLSENLKPGKYTFFCSVDGHEAAGMKGTLTVK